MDRRLGCDLELRGTYVHWYQPHLWSELTRYNLDIFEAAPAKRTYWITDGKVKSGTMEKLRSILNESYEQMMKEAITSNKEISPMLKPNQLTSYIEEMRHPESGFYLAGTTYANGWARFIDGTIENGFSIGRKIHDYLKK